MHELIIRYYHSKKPTCQVCYRSEQGTQETTKFPFTFSVSQENRELIQWYLEEYLTYPYGAYQDRAKRAEQVISELGTELFNTIFHNKNDQEQSAIRFYDRALENPTDCTINIQADHTSGWSLPWEFMQDPAYGYLSQKTQGFIRSHLGINAHLNPIRSDTPKIKILMVISRPSGEEDVPFQSVARPLMEIFRSHQDRVQIDVLRPPTFEQLQKVLSDKPNYYHILHFDGHGIFPEPSGIDYHAFFAKQGSLGQLLFENDKGEERFVSGEELGKLLSGKGVPVVMLNACQSGMTHPDAVYPSVGGELLKTGALGVVAMAYSVYVHTAAQFMARVYESLINGQTLAHAVTIAREGLAVRDKRESPIGKISLQDWVVPVLFQSGEVQLFEPAKTKLHLDASLIEDKQAAAGTEIGLPGEPDYGFIGRDNDVWKLEKAFEKETIVLLQAMAGVGKTTTAVGFARWWAETGALEGPIFFFSFESPFVSLAQVCDHIGTVFRETIKSQLNIEWALLDVSQRRKLAVEILQQLPCLLIWDNFEPIAGFPKGTPTRWKQEEQLELKDFLHALRGGKTKVIITSRRDEAWLGGCYKSITLHGLNRWDAIELAGKVLDRTGINRQQIKPYNRLLEYLQGNPLSIQVILPELKHIELDELLQALQRGQAKLSKDDKAQGREHSLSASLDYRLDRLDESMRSRLGILGLFQGFVNVGTLALFCKNDKAPEILRELDSDTWTQMLDKLAEIGLLRKIGTGLYTIHPALPWFFNQILRTSYVKNIEWLQRRFVNVYGDLSLFLQQQLLTNAEIAMTYLHLEEQNLQYVLYLGCEYKMWHEVGLIFSTMAEMLGKQSRWMESELLTLEIKKVVIDKQDEPLAGAEILYASVWHNLGMIAEEQRRFDEAKQWYTRSLALTEKLNDEYGQAQTLHQLGIIAQKLGQFDAAEQWYRKSLTLTEKLNNEYMQAYTLHQLGMIAEDRRQFNEAEQWYMKSLKIKEKLNDEYSQAITLHQLGNIAYKRRQFDAAEQWCMKSLALTKKLNNEYGQAQSLHQLGMIAQKLGRFDAAEKWYRKSLALCEKLHDEYGMTQMLHQLGRIAEDRRQFNEAEQWYRKSLAISEKFHDEYGMTFTFHQLGRIAEERRQFDDAELWYRKSLAIKEKLHYEYDMAGTLHQLGRIAEERQQFDKAEQLYLQAEVILVKYKDEYTLSIVRKSLARLCKNHA
ncbi:MAG: tetratricopeptide repeat protein [bacterium]